MSPETPDTDSIPLFSVSLDISLFGQGSLHDGKIEIAAFFRLSFLEFGIWKIKNIVKLCKLDSHKSVKSTRSSKIDSQKLSLTVYLGFCVA